MGEQVYEGYCWGGPLHGTYAASKTDYIRSVVSRKDSAKNYLKDDGATVSADGPNFVFYNIERFRIGGMLFIVWVVQQPKERKEAVIQTIVEGMTLIHILCNL